MNMSSETSFAFATIPQIALFTNASVRRLINCNLPIQDAFHRFIKMGSCLINNLGFIKVHSCW